MDWEKLEKADWLFRKMVRRFVKERDKVLIEGITLPALLVLHKIIRDGEQRLGDLAEQLDFTSGAVTALCDKLEEKGLAIRRRGEDRRSVLLDITEQGREMVRRNRNIGDRCITVLFANEGIGFMIWSLRLYFKTDWIFVGLFCLGIMGFVTDRLLTSIGSSTLSRYGITKAAFNSRLK